MKKIMFNDKYGLTEAVLKGRKTMTRRVITQKVDIVRHFNPRLFPEGYDPMAFYRDDRGMCRLIDTDGNYINPTYQVGEEVAVAQAYTDIPFEHWKKRGINLNLQKDGTLKGLVELKGWDNKMFVRADAMPYRIRITNIKVEKLQDISDDDCLKEGIVKLGFLTYSYKDSPIKKELFRSPQFAFSELIDKVSGKGTWARNPYVFAYSFKLIK